MNLSIGFEVGIPTKIKPGDVSVIGKKIKLESWTEFVLEVWDIGQEFIVGMLHSDKSGFKSQGVFPIENEFRWLEVVKVGKGQ